VRGRDAVRIALLALVGSAMLVFTGVAASASSYVDAEGDANTPADVVAVGVADGPNGTIGVTVEVSNYRTLPPNSSLSVWLDTDASPGTGNAEGREARVRYEANGAIGLQLWSGTRLVDQPPTGITGGFADGRLSLSIPRSTVKVASGLGIYVVSARAQPAGSGEFVASDAAPNSGNYVFRGPEPARFTEPAGDHHSAPDITSVRVTDAEDGWVAFAVTIPNAGLLPRAPVVGLSIDTDDDLATGDAGSDLGITALGTDFIADRWNERSRTWVPVVGEPMVRIEATGTTVVVSVHRSEIGAGERFRFAALAAGLTSTDAFTGVDVSPDGARFFQYVLENRVDVRLVTGKLRTVPGRPARGARLTVATTVARSDTGMPTRTGSATCVVKINGKRVAATGRYADGKASCTFGVPKKARRIAGTMTVRADGIASTVPFSYVVR
jgi:hypothetical protein